MEFSTVENNTSDFNSGLAIIFRLDAIHKELHITRSKKDHEGYYQALVSFFMELIRSIVRKHGATLESNEEFQLHKSTWESVKTSYFEIQKLKQQGRAIPSSLWDNMYWWEIQLTVLEQKTGYGMPHTDPRYRN